MQYALGILLALVGLAVVALLALAPFFLLLFVGERLLDLAPFGRAARFALLMVKNLRRNLVRTALAYVATFVLVVVVTMVWTILHYLNALSDEKAQDVKVIVSEKWSIVSQLPRSYEGPLAEGAADPNDPGAARPLDHMTWQFYFGTLDPAKQTPENTVVCIALEPRKAVTMMDDLFDDFSPDGVRVRGKPSPEQQADMERMVREMETNRRAAVVGRHRLRLLGKRVGDRFTVTGMSHKGIDLEFEVIGSFPGGRYDDLVILNREYLIDAIDQYPKTHAGARHPRADRPLDIVWLKVADSRAYGQVAGQIEASSYFRDPPVKCETLSSAVATQLEGFRHLIWGMKWLVSPALVVAMTLVIANAISISVRERRRELAVLKVLGFRPAQVLALVLGEALLIGAASGLVSAAVTWVTVNLALTNVLPILIFVPADAFWWGPAVGALTALAGSALPAWSACQVKVSEVFARVA